MSCRLCQTECTEKEKVLKLRCIHVHVWYSICFTLEIHWENYWKYYFDALFNLDRRKK